jgi:hypothetical protein
LISAGLTFNCRRRCTRLEFSPRRTLRIIEQAAVADPTRRASGLFQKRRRIPRPLRFGSYPLSNSAIAEEHSERRAALSHDSAGRFQHLRVLSRPAWCGTRAGASGCIASTGAASAVYEWRGTSRSSIPSGCLGAWRRQKKGTSRCGYGCSGRAQGWITDFTGVWALATAGDELRPADSGL